MAKTFKQAIVDALHKCGRKATISSDEVLIEKKDGSTRRLVVQQSEEQEYSKVIKARSKSFDLSNRCYVENGTVEVMIARLKPYAWSSPEVKLSDARGNKVIIAHASLGFMISFLESDEYVQYFNGRGVADYIDRYTYGLQSKDVLWTPYTARYVNKGKKIPSNLTDLARARIRDCLLKIAVEQHDPMLIWSRAQTRSALDVAKKGDHDGMIPDAQFDTVATNYYLVATASIFTSQRFLAYYHVMEFNFLTVSESRLHERIKSIINEPSFDRRTAGIDKLIAAVRNQDATSDETELLRAVLDRYVSEGDLLEFVSQHEANAGEKIYSKHKVLFGEQMQGIVSGSAVAHASKLIKHIRNAIVHSSDRHKRNDRFVPLSDSEMVVEAYLPLVRFLAEKVIYGTATQPVRAVV